MRAAREEAGWRSLGAWLRLPEAKEAGFYWSRPHLSNIEHGNYPSFTREIVEAYERAFSAEADQTRLQSLWETAMAEAGEGSTGKPVQDAARADGVRPHDARGRISAFQLPPDIPDFTARETLLGELRRVLTDNTDSRTSPALVAVAGKPGVGKSTLAIHVAHQLRERFPDAQLYVDLRGAEAPLLSALDPAEALAGFLNALGVRDVPAHLSGRVALYRSLLVDRRALVVLDNASREEQVRPLIPGSASCAVLITSRTQLGALEGAQLHELDVLEPDAAIALLEKAIPWAHREKDLEAAAEIARYCGYLPLAIRIAAGRLKIRPRWSLRTLAGRLAVERHRLDELNVGDLDARTSFRVSYNELEPAEARLFRRLSVLGGADFAAPVAATLAEVDEYEAEALLDRLLALQLLDAATEDRYHFHDLLRLFARERFDTEEPEATRAEAAARAVHWFLKSAQAAATQYNPGSTPSARTAGLAWFEAERANLVGAVNLAHHIKDWESTWRLALALLRFYWIRAYHDDFQQTYEVALDATRRSGARDAEANILRLLGNVYETQGRLDFAESCYEGCLAIARELEDKAGEADALYWLALQKGDLDEARDCCERKVAVCRELGARHSEAMALINLGITCRQQGHLQDAKDCFEQSRAAFEETGDREGVAQSLIGLGATHLTEGDLDKSIDCTKESLAAVQDLGVRRFEAGALLNLGIAYQRKGSLGNARKQLQASLEASRDLGDRYGEAAALGELALVYEQQGSLDDATSCREQSTNIYQSLGHHTEEGPP